MSEQIAALVAWLTDRKEWNWTRAISQEDAAHRVLEEMAELGLIEARNHPFTFGGHAVWIVNGKMFGRTDGISLDRRKENGDFIHE